MEKKTFITLVMSVIGGMFFALGMCMCLLPEWNMFHEGVVLGVIGAIELLITWLVHRKMSGKQPLKVNAKVVGKVLYGIVAAIVFGVGMAMVMAFDMMIPGIIVGIVGIVLLLFLIPMCVGLKDSSK